MIQNWEGEPYTDIFDYLFEIGLGVWGVSPGR